MVKEVCHAEVLEKISYQITLRSRAWSLKTYGAPLARESSGESFFRRILYRSFSFSKVSKSSTTATTYYYISHALPSHWRTGRIFRSRATLRNRVLKHMTKNVCDLFLKEANNMVLFAYSQHTHQVNEEEECFSFSCNMMF